MQLVNAPLKIVLPFADGGGKNVIPVASQIGITDGAASLTDGFPPLTRTPIASGGVPPFGLDMNGILFDVSAIVRWANAGAGYVYDTVFANDADVGGYPKGARVLRTDGLGYWLNTVDDNVDDPESSGAAAAGWVPDYTNGYSAITMAGANVTLTELEYGKPIIVISGVLSANVNLIFPSIVGLWSIENNTTGSYDITCKTAAGAGVVAGATCIVWCDGVDVKFIASNLTTPPTDYYSIAGGTADAITGSFPNISLLSYLTGAPFWIRALYANTTTTPTATFNSGVLAPKTITKYNNQALNVGDIGGAGHILQLQYDSVTDTIRLNNPATRGEGNYAGYVSITTTPYTFLAANKGKLHVASGSASVVNMGAIASENPGDNFPLLNLKAGDITVTRDGASTFEGVSGSTTDFVLSQYCSVDISKISASVREVVGLLSNNSVSRKFKSSPQTITDTTSATYTFAHGLGVTPDMVSIKLICLSADQGWSVGNTALVSIAVGVPGGSGSGAGVQIDADATNVVVYTGVQGIAIMNKSTRELELISAASKWSMSIIAYA